MTLHDFVARVWAPPREWERVVGVLSVRGDLVIVTDFAVYRMTEDCSPLGFTVQQVAAL